MDIVLQRLKDFRPHQNVAYRFDYDIIYQDIITGKQDFPAVVRWHVMNDIFFIVYFIMWHDESANDPKGYFVERCKEIESDIMDYEADECFNFLDLWAREHGKSSVITKACTIQNICKYPEKATCIFSFKKGNAVKFQDSIAETFEKKRILADAFPEVTWHDPKGSSKCWSSDRGLLFKRNSTRQEKTVETCGLTEGMSTGMHYDYLIFDDIETDDIAENPDQLVKVSKKLDVARNMGKSEQEGGMKGSMFRIVGTPYSHLGALVQAREKKILNELGEEEPMYRFRLRPVMDGAGAPYLVSERKLRELKASDYFNSQQMCDPTPEESAAFTGKHLLDIPDEKIPDNLVKYLLVDWAGNMTDKAAKDAWAIELVGVDPNVDDLGASDIYILDMVLMPMEEEHAIREVINMYKRNGIVQALCIEQVNNAFLTTHIADILRRDHHIDLSEKYGTLIPLRPRGRNKLRRIRTALGWSFRNGKIKIATSIPVAFRDRLRNEMDKFGAWHDDGLDALSYIRDVMDETGFKYKITGADESKVISLLTHKQVNNRLSWMCN